MNIENFGMQMPGWYDIVRQRVGLLEKVDEDSNMSLMLISFSSVTSAT